MEYSIGTKFKTRGKAPKVCIVTDILKTYNSAGDLVKTRYQASHEFMGQIVTDYDLCATTIAMGLIVEVTAWANNTNTLHIATGALNKGLMPLVFPLGLLL